MRSRPGRTFIYITAAVLFLLGCVLKWGSRILVNEDDLPAHVECAVVLQGSLNGEKARLAGAVTLLQRGIASEVLVSIPEKGFWDQDIRPVALNYLKTKFGEQVAAHIIFCETGSKVDSTEREAEVLVGCIREHGWRQVTVVTSNYHTRRAGIIWRRIARKQDPQLQLWMHAVSNPDFNASRWWAERTSAKTWLLELMKLMANLL
jgi:uncharacterized SAM-binding protein YcdF (DUF218 family)